MSDIYLDCANLEQMLGGRRNPLVKGFTTNPSLARSAGVTNYEEFCRAALAVAEGLPVSLEVLSDDFAEMERQARKIASFGPNAVVKIPVTNTKGESAAPLIRRLSDSGIFCNVTAVFIKNQANLIASMVNLNDPIIISVFCGRINDAGMEFDGLNDLDGRYKNVKMLWASCRQIYSIYQAEKDGWDIITVTPDLLAKYEKLKGKDLTKYSLDTVKMFYDDAQKAGYTL